jgi:hypothetical protein
MMAGVSILVLCVAAPQPPSSPPPIRQPSRLEARLRERLKPDEGGWFERLVAAGGDTPAAFDVYADFLADGDDEHLVIATLIALRVIDKDRSRFLPAALGLLNHPRPMVRFDAVQLVGAIGSARDAAPVAVLLSDENWDVMNAAARTLAKIGGDREVVAFDVWLRTTRRRKEDIAHVVKCRDELRARLATAPPAAQTK